MINYNSSFNSNFDNNVEFVDVNLFCNNQNIQILANNINIGTKKRRILEIKNKSDKSSNN